MTVSLYTFCFLFVLPHALQCLKKFLFLWRHHKVPVIGWLQILCFEQDLGLQKNPPILTCKVLHVKFYWEFICTMCICSVCMCVCWRGASVLPSLSDRSDSWCCANRARVSVVASISLVVSVPLLELESVQGG